MWNRLPPLTGEESSFATTSREFALLTETEAIKSEARTTIEGVRAGIADVFGACPGGVRRPTELARALEIDKTLAWKLFRCVEAADPFTAAQLLPGQSGMDIFFGAASQKGIAEPVVRRAVERYDAYEQMVQRHAGDRRTFQRMMGSFSPEAQTDAAQAHRKAAFEANSFIWGVKVRTQLAIHLVRANEDGQSVDIAAIGGFVELVRMRPQTSWVISRTAYVSEDGVIQPALPRQPIDGPADPEKAWDTQSILLQDFCSKPPPQLTREPVAGNYLETRLAPGAVGKTAATTLTFGEVYHRVAPRFRDQQPDDDAKFYVRLRTPAESFVSVMLVQRGIYTSRPPSFGVYGELDAELHHPAKLSEQTQLASDAEIEHLGQADGPIVWAREVPALGSLIEHACRRLNWPIGEFDAYQVRQNYPILRSVAITGFQVPKRDA